VITAASQQEGRCYGVGVVMCKGAQDKARKLMRMRRENQLKVREPGSVSSERSCNATAMFLYREVFFIPSKSDWCVSMTC